MAKEEILSDEAILTALQKLPGWTRAGDRLEKAFEFANFREAFAFMVRVAFEAEAMDHHPDWTNCYSDVTIRLSTHHAGNKITDKDVALAAKIEGCA
ncbi:MAG TPA: 4a-hydroxytetrahydrobiopterin dehydratase [Opitutaceae bacterium]|jgi:4a-hydroxytetrahydrobiopterin dehydratase